MIDRVTQRFGLRLQRLVGDTAYGVAPMLDWMVEERPIAAHVPVWDKTGRKDDTPSAVDFEWPKTPTSTAAPRGRRLQRGRPFKHVSARPLHHCAIRSAFGRVLNLQPLMQNVLADLVLENEGALALTMRLARAMDHRADEHEDLLVRLCTAVGKYWICKRTPNHAYEAMECIGGSGVMEDDPFARLFRESPVNAIWEGSGNVQCLDVLRAIQKTPAVVEAFFCEVAKARGASSALDHWTGALQHEFADRADIEYRARDFVDRMALAIQAALLLQHAPATVADAICASRLAKGGHRNYGTLPRGVDCAALIERATPHA